MKNNIEINTYSINSNQVSIVYLFLTFFLKIFSNMSNYPKKLNGLCVGILSGDRVLFQGPPDTVNGGYKQKILHLTGIQAPKVDTVNGND